MAEFGPASSRRVAVLALAGVLSLSLVAVAVSFASRSHAAHHVSPVVEGVAGDNGGPREARRPPRRPPEHHPMWPSYRDRSTAAPSEVSQASEREDVELEPFQLDVLELEPSAQVRVLEGDFQLILAMCSEELDTRPREGARLSVSFTLKPFRGEATLASVAFTPKSDVHDPELLDCASRMLHEEVLPAEFVDALPGGELTVEQGANMSPSSMIEDALPAPPPNGG